MFFCADHAFSFLGLLQYDFMQKYPLYSAPAALLCTFILIRPGMDFPVSYTQLVITLSCLTGSHNIVFLIPYCKEKAQIILNLISSSSIAGTSVFQTVSSTHIYWSCLSFTSVHLWQNAIMLYHQVQTVSNAFPVPWQMDISPYRFLTPRRKF